MKRRAALVLAMCGATGCEGLTTTFDRVTFSGDAYPITIHQPGGALVAGLSEVGEEGVRTAVVDILAPLTLVDRGADAPQEFVVRDILLYGATAPDQPLDVPRARFSTKTIAVLHPCRDDEASCTIGDPAAPTSFSAIVGMDAFASDALRLRLGDSQMFVLADIGGDDSARSRACDAVLDGPFRGGGTVIFGGSEVDVPSRRVTVDTCLAPAPAAATQRERGLDALFVMSTAIGPSIMNESTYARYRELAPTEPTLETLPASMVLLPSGLVSGRLTSLPSIALVGNLDSAPRAPCRQVYASHLLEGGSCKVGVDCPCSNGDTFCAAPAIVELAPTARLPFVIVSDSDPTLQALRTELRPDQPEVDGILGTSVLGDVELDLDYANSRLLGRCVDRTTCGARIEIADSVARRTLISCLGDQRGPIP